MSQSWLSVSKNAAMSASKIQLNAIYEEDLLDVSYEFRPGRSQHDALDALYLPVPAQGTSVHARVCDRAGPAEHSHNALHRVAFRYLNGVGTPIDPFAAQWLACTLPCQRFAPYLRLRRRLWYVGTLVRHA